MAQSTLDQRIQFLQTCGDQLMQQIQSLEIGMNRKKQQNQQPDKNEITIMKSLVKKMLYLLAEINTCQYFEKYQFNFNFNGYYYKQMCTRYYQKLMLRFILKLKAKNKDFPIN